MDELLTAFFHAEIPESRLSDLPPGLQAAAARPDMSVQVGQVDPVDLVDSRNRSGERWTTLALAGCAAALLAAAVLAVRFGGSGSDEAPRVGAAAVSSPDKQAINVSHDEADDLTAPEQDIEILEKPNAGR